MNYSKIRTLSPSEFAKLVGGEHQSEDLYVHISSKKFSEIPIRYPFKSDNYELIFVTTGTLKIIINLITYTLKKNECIAIATKAVTQIVEMSANLTLIGISFSNKFILENLFNKGSIDAFEFLLANETPKLVATEDEFYKLQTMSNLLKDYNCLEAEFPYKEDLIRSVFSVVLYNYAAIFKRLYPALKVQFSKQQYIALKFWNLLEQHVKSERTVPFYAEILNVTSGHLSKVLKKVTGKSASQIIDEAVTVEARYMLENSPLSIAEISDELQFSNPSFFGKFIKKQLGSSPSAYRSQNRK